MPYLINDMKYILGVRVPLQALVKRLSFDLTGGQFKTVCNPGLLNHNQIFWGHSKRMIVREASCHSRIDSANDGTACQEFFWSQLRWTGWKLDEMILQTSQKSSCN